MGMFFTISELCRSNVAALKGIRNEPTMAVKVNLNKLIDNVLDPIRSAYGDKVFVNSGYRCESLNELVGGAKNSDHLRGFAADITAGSKEENKRLFGIILGLGEKDVIEWRQLIDENNYSWIHISYNEDDNKKQVLHLGR